MKGFSIILIYCCLFLTSVDSYGQNVDQLRKQREKSIEEINQAEELLKKTDSLKKNELEKLKLINRKIVTRKKVINGIGDEIALIDKKIRTNQTNIDSLETMLSEMKKDYANAIVKTYRSRSSYDKSQYILASKDINQAYRRIKYLQEYAKYRREQAGKIVEKAEELKKAIQDQENDKLYRKNLLITENKEVVRLNADKDQKEDYLKGIKSQEKQIKKELDALRANYRRLEKEIGKLVSDAQGTEMAASGMRLTPEEKIVSNEFSQNMGKLPWPVKKGIITMEHGKQNVQGLRNVEIDNPGITIMTEDNEVIQSVFEGKVSSIMLLAGGKTCVLIKHGEYFSVYLNISELKVKEGDLVKMKQELGKVRKEAKEGNPEIMFQIWKGKENLDPEKWLAK